MRRREFLSLVGGAAAWPVVQDAKAQSSITRRKIGYLHPATADPASPMVTILRPRWRELGYVEGETILLRSAQLDMPRLPALVAELIALRVDVLIVVGPQAVQAARGVTSTVPIVGLDLENDPVKAGMIARWTNPGGNMTGLFLDQASLAGKWLELLREIAPSLKRVALMWDPNTGPFQLEAARSAARALGFDALVLEVDRPERIEPALATLGTEPATGVLLLGSPVLVSPAHPFADAALKFRLPSVSFYKPIAQAGGLVAYGANLETYFPRCIDMAHAILNGANPGSIPIERPDRFELVINFRTAKALGLTVPQTLQVAADEVIE